MSRTEKDDYFREKFLDAIVAQGTGVEGMSDFARRFDDRSIKEIFSRWSRSGRELFFIKKVGFVNVHVRSEPPGFWGVTKNVINDFHAVREYLNTPCWFVLLVGQEYNNDLNGYILEDIFSPPIIKKPSEQDEAYKINERNLDQNMMIRSTYKIVMSLIERGNLKTQGSRKVIRRPRKDKLKVI